MVVVTGKAGPDEVRELDSDGEEAAAAPIASAEERDTTGDGTFGCAGPTRKRYVLGRHTCNMKISVAYCVRV